jgi:hypothetical protein
VLDQREAESRISGLGVEHPCALYLHSRALRYGIKNGALQFGAFWVLAAADPVRAKGTRLPALGLLPLGSGLLLGSASASTPAGCLLQLVHGLDEGARGAKSYRKTQ